MAINALYTGASGLAANSTALDVVGNNLANLNTVGFKTQRALFRDAVYQTLSSGSAASGSFGGTNPVQMGFGVSVGAVDSLFTQGTLNPTGNALDLGINGRGFFVVSNGTQTSYTRTGSFNVDDTGILVDSSTGFRVQRFGSIGESTATTSGFQTTGDLDIHIPFGVGLAGVPTTTAVLQGNIDSRTSVGGSFDRFFQVFDSQSTIRSMTLTFTKTAVNTYSLSASMTGATVTVPPTSIQFDQQGQLLSPTTLDVTITGLPSASDQTITFDLGDSGTANGLSQFGDDSTVSVVSQNGIGSGTLNTVSVDLSGIIQGTFSNGRTVPIAQIAIAGFNNEAGLIRQGNNYYGVSPSSGNPILGPAGSGGLGLVQGGTLEGANVDIATEFAKLIIAQRGFQVSAQTVTAANEMLQTVSNILR